MGGGPDRVFVRPVADILPQLAGATATDVTGRVGRELVFWEYRLRDGRLANLYVCARAENVDCESRGAAVCPAGGDVLARGEEPGRVRRMNCTTVGVAQPGELFPNCQVRELEDRLLVGLVECQTGD